VPFYIQLNFYTSIDVVERRRNLCGRTFHSRSLSSLAVSALFDRTYLTSACPFRQAPGLCGRVENVTDGLMFSF
jgi:hypothetical protein